MKYIVYDQDTGKILRSGVCIKQDFEGQARRGEKVMEVLKPVSDILHKVVGGEVVDRDPSEIKALPAPDPREDLIRAKECEILRRMAIEELTAEGKL